MPEKERKIVQKKSSDERRLTEKAAKKASSTAIRISTALKLPIQLVKGNKIILQEVDGTTTEIKKVNQVKSKIDLSKGTKICLVQKG